MLCAFHQLSGLYLSADGRLHISQGCWSVGDTSCRSIFKSCILCARAIVTSSNKSRLNVCILGLLATWRGEQNVSIIQCETGTTLNCKLYPTLRMDITSVPSKAVRRKIGPALQKMCSTDFVKMSKKDAPLGHLANFPLMILKNSSNNFVKFGGIGKLKNLLREHWNHLTMHFMSHRVEMPTLF